MFYGFFSPYDESEHHSVNGFSLIFVGRVGMILSFASRKPQKGLFPTCSLADLCMFFNLRQMKREIISWSTLGNKKESQNCPYLSNTPRSKISIFKLFAILLLFPKRN